MSNPYGPYQNPLAKQGAVTVFMYNVLKGFPITIWGDGSVVRDYVFIDDVVDVLFKAGSLDLKEKRIFNVGSGQGVSLNELIKDIGQVTKLEPLVIKTAARNLDVPANTLNAGAAREHLGWSQKVSMLDGLEATKEWLLKLIAEDSSF